MVLDAVLATVAPEADVDGAGFRAVVEEVTTDDPAQDGRVVDQDPAGNTTAVDGSNVTIVVGVFEAPTTGGATDGG